mgnify:FL=1
MSNTSAQISSSTNKHYIMKYISISLVSLLLSFNVQAEIESKELLNSILESCVEEEDAEFNEIFSAGEQIEFCGCYVNTISKTMDAKELVKLGVDLIKEGDGGLNEEITDAQIDILFNNEKILDGLLSCMVKVLE